MSDPQTKRCSKCKLDKPFDDFGSHAQKSDGKQTRCRKCVNSANKRLRNDDPDRLTKEAKYREQNREYRNAYCRDWRSSKIDEMLAYEQAYRDSNRDRLRSNHKVWRDANRERLLVWAANYRAENKEMIRKAQQKYHNSDYGKAAQKNRNHARRSHERHPDETDITPEWLIALAEAQSNCSICEIELTHSNSNDPTHRNLDHIWPLNAGGKHMMGNVRYTCRQCNIRRPRDGGGPWRIASEMILHHGAMQLCLS